MAASTQGSRPVASAALDRTRVGSRSSCRPPGFLAPDPRSQPGRSSARIPGPGAAVWVNTRLRFSLSVKARSSRRGWTPGSPSRSGLQAVHVRPAVGPSRCAQASGRGLGKRPRQSPPWGHPTLSQSPPQPPDLTWPSPLLESLPASARLALVPSEGRQAAASLPCRTRSPDDGLAAGVADASAPVTGSSWRAVAAVVSFCVTRATQALPASAQGPFCWMS